MNGASLAWLTPSIQFTRLPLCLMVATSALAGYRLFPEPHNVSTAFYLFTGVFLLCAGATGLNQVQEAELDNRMERTQKRPIPSGLFSRQTGLLLALTLCASSLLLMGFTLPQQVWGLGAFSLLWYNGLYTPLKKFSAFAALPGSLCGAIPPLMGWSAAGGNITDYRAVLFSGLFVLWQLPHFWLLALKHKEDLEKLNLPSVFSHFTDNQLRRLIFLWTCCLATATFLTLCLGLIKQSILQLTLSLGIVGVLVLSGLELSRPVQGFIPSRSFVRLNLLMLLIIGCVLIDF